MSDMTRSEAIDVIELIMRKYEEDECICCDITLGDEDYEALRLARDSLKVDEAYQLEYESTTKNNLGVDAISRQAVLDLIADYDLSMGQVVKGIHALPSVTPQTRQGHWIRVTDKTGHLVWECDKCGWQQRFNTNFCPDCGSGNSEVEE